MRLTTGLLALTLCAQCVYANEIETKFVSRMANTMDYVEKNQDAVWPGFHLNATPIILDLFDFEAGTEHIYALNYKPLNLPWKKLKLENQEAFYLDENLIDPALYVHDGHFFEVENQRSFIDTESTDDLPANENFSNKLTYSRALLYMRSESRVEKNNLDDLTRDYDGFYDLTNVKLIYLENAAMTAYLTTKGQSSAAALQDAVAVHQYREQLLDKDLRAFEYADEVFMGTPRFISWKSMNLKYDDYVLKTHLTGCKPLSILIGVQGIINCVVAGYPDFTSTTYGHALDQILASGSWKNSVETQYKSISHVAQDYYQMSDATAKMMAEAAMANPRYNYTRISSVIDDMIVPHVAKMKAAVAEYNQDPGIELYGPLLWNFIENFVDEGSGEGYMVNLTKELRKDLYGDFAFSDADGTESESLSYKHLPYAYTVFKYDARNDYIDMNNSWSIFKLESSAILVIDGVADTVGNFVKSGKILPYSKLSIDDAHISIKLQAGARGVIEASGGSLKLRIPYDMDKASLSRSSLSKRIKQNETKQPLKLNTLGFSYKW